MSGLSPTNWTAASSWLRLLTPARRRAMRHGLMLGGLASLAYILVIRPPGIAGAGSDAYGYWIFDLADLYRGQHGELGFFPYSPAAALAAAPLTVLPWPAFLAVWYSLLVGTYVWLTRGLALALVAFPPVVIELYHGNIHLLLAAVTVLGFRYPALWSFALLTKVTPGLGLLWFVARREWHSLAAALGATALIAGASFVVLPVQWQEWLTFLSSSTGATIGGSSIAIPLWIRLPIAAVIVWIGAKRDAKWTLPLAVTIALPILWTAGLSVLVGCVPLLAAKRHSHLADAD